MTESMQTGVELVTAEHNNIRPFSIQGQGSQIISQIDSSIGLASQAVSMSLDAGAEDQIKAIKANLKYLEENMFDEKLKKNELTEEEIKDLLKKFAF